MGKFAIDAAWVGEIIRQGALVAVALGWWQADMQTQALVVSFLSLLVTGIVGTRTASARVIENAAGMSVAEVKAVAADPTKELVPVKVVDTSKD